MGKSGLISRKYILDLDATEAPAGVRVGDIMFAAFRSDKGRVRFRSKQNMYYMVQQGGMFFKDKTRTEELTALSSAYFYPSVSMKFPSEGERKVTQYLAGGTGFCKCGKKTHMVRRADYLPLYLEAAKKAAKAAGTEFTCGWMDDVVPITTSVYIRKNSGLKLTFKVDDVQVIPVPVPE